MCRKCIKLMNFWCRCIIQLFRFLRNTSTFAQSLPQQSVEVVGVSISISSPPSLCCCCCLVAQFFSSQIFCTWAENSWADVVMSKVGAPCSSPSPTGSSLCPTQSLCRSRRLTPWSSCRSPRFLSYWKKNMEGF